MKFLKVFAAVALSLTCLSSQAGVIYEWKPLNQEVPFGFALRLEVARDAVRSGALSFATTLGEPQKFPNAGLLSLRYRAGQGIIDYSPRREVLDPWGAGEVTLDLRFDASGFATGYLYANDTMSHFEISSSGRVFSVLDANSDAGMDGAGCGSDFDTPCYGAMGELVQIPEPQSLALLGLGGLAVLAARSRTRRRRAAATAAA